VFSAAIVTSGLWLFPFHYLYQWAALAIMLVLLVLCLWSVDLSRRESKWAQYTSELYLGWITVATAANIAVVVVSTPWLSSIGIFGSNIWAIIGLAIATLVHTGVALKYRVYIPGLVLIWALIANMVAHTDMVQRIGVAACIVWMLGVFVANFLRKK
jgi:translocator protein